jgi:predicted transposase/invertase (TIGR01784 family)
MKFLDVKTDYAFKKVFGSNNSKDILISFLNAIIDFPNGKKVVSLDIVDPYNIPMIKGMKDTFVDVKAILDNETTVIIEMQVLNVDAFEERILYNAAKKYSNQLVKGENYTLLNPIIALTVVNFEMYPEFEKVISRFQLMEKEEFTSYSDDVELIFVELPKFKKKLEELKDIKDEWIYFIKNAEDLTVIPSNVDKEVKNALNIVNEAGMTEQELELQHKRKDFIWQQKSSVEKAERLGREEGLEKGREEGLEEGLQKGREEGREEGVKEGVEKGRLEMAINCINQNLDFEIISKISGLTIEKIKIIKNDAKLQ